MDKDVDEEVSDRGEMHTHCVDVGRKEEYIGLTADVHDHSDTMEHLSLHSLPPRSHALSLSLSLSRELYIRQAQSLCSSLSPHSLLKGRQSC